MSLYQDAFGFTTLRVFVDGFELWLGLVVLMLVVGVLRLSWRWVPRAVLVAGAVFTLGFAAMNPDGWVAGQNIDRFEASGKVDTLYLSTLSADAAPTIAERLPREVVTCIAAYGPVSSLWGDGGPGPTTGSRGTSAGPAPRTPWAPSWPPSRAGSRPAATR